MKEKKEGISESSFTPQRFSKISLSAVTWQQQNMHLATSNRTEQTESDRKLQTT